MKISLFLLKFIVIIVLFLFLYNNQSLDFRILKGLHSNPSTISFAIALMVLSTTLAGIRLLVILKILGIHVTALRSIGVTFIGHLSANVALGPLFSEVVRLTYLFGNSKRGLSHALSALLIDKLLGMAGLLMVITGIIVIFTEKATLASPNNTELLSLMIGVFLSIIIVIFFSPAIMSKLSIFLQKFGKVKWSQQAQELSAALRNFQTLPTKTFFVFLLIFRFSFSLKSFSRFWKALLWVDIFFDELFFLDLFFAININYPLIPIFLIKFAYAFIWWIGYGYIDLVCTFAFRSLFFIYKPCGW